MCHDLFFQSVVFSVYYSVFLAVVFSICQYSLVQSVLCVLTKCFSLCLAVSTKCFSLCLAVSTKCLVSVFSCQY